MGNGEWEMRNRGLRPWRLRHTHFPLFVLLGAVLLLLSAARAEGLGVSLSLEPDQLPDPGEAALVFELYNDTDHEIQNLCLISPDGLLSESVGTLAAGEHQTLRRPYSVSREELEAGWVTYLVSYDAPGPEAEKVTLTASAPVRQGYPTPEVSFTRQLSSRYVTRGHELVIAYRVTNNGSSPLTDLILRDRLGNYAEALSQLEAGGSHTFMQRLTIQEESFSEASLEYRDAEGASTLRSLTPLRVQLSQGILNADFSLGRAAFDPDRADAVLILSNQGDDDYRNITVFDDVYGGIIADGLSLSPGDNPTEVAFTYPVRGDGEYRWRVTGTSRTGDEIDFVTETLTLPASDVPRSVDIWLSVSPRTTSLRRPGRVTFDVSIENTGTVSAKSLRFYEVERGDIRTLVVLPTGDPSRFSVSYDVTGDSRFIFCLNYIDPEGRARTVSADPIDIDITPGGAMPESEGADDLRLTGASGKPGSNATFTILLIVATAALVFMFTLLLVTSLRARRQRRRAAQQKHQRPGRKKA